MKALVRRWGDGICFGVEGVSETAGQLTREVSVGDVAFCPSGNLVCVFFGPTPASVTEKPVAENPAVVIGRTLASPDELRSVAEATAITVAVYNAPVLAAPQAPAAPSVPAPAASGVSASRDGFGERKLSQAEIDALVQQLLAEKRKSQQ